MVTIIKQSGNPVDEGDAKAFLEEWKEGFDKPPPRVSKKWDRSNHE